MADNRPSASVPRLLIDPADPAGFGEQARDYGWHTQAGSEGKCWLIAVTFAHWATTRAGLPAERIQVLQIENIHSARRADDSSNLVAIDGMAIDWASQGGASPRPAWPEVTPLEELAERLGGHAQSHMCPGCGLGREKPKHRCPGHAEPLELRGIMLSRLEASSSPPQIKRRQRAVIWAMFQPSLTMRDVLAGHASPPAWVTR